MNNELDHIKFLSKNGGVKKVLEYIHENIFFDLKHGTDTSSWLEKVDFSPRPPNLEHGIRYRASLTSEINNALKEASKLTDTSKATFYDLGCGKGKTLCIAGMNHDFNKKVGVDYHEPLIATAGKNLEKCNVEADLHVGDMTQFEEYDDQSIVYLYNPADEEVLQKVKSNLEQFSKSAMVIYNKPVHANVFDDWKKVYSQDNDDPDHQTHIYTYDNN